MNKNFSYRVQGVVLREGCVLLQTDARDAELAYALPGGSVEFGESAADALVREFHEEMGVAIKAGEFAWVTENFFTWNEQNYAQIAMTFYVRLIDELPSADFAGCEPHLRLHWMPVERLGDITVYPQNLSELLCGDAKHVVRKDW